MARYPRNQGVNYNGVQVAHLVTRRTLAAPVADNRHYVGNNRMNWIGPVVFPAFNDDNHLMLKWKVKKECFSAACVAESKVGGVGPGGSGSVHRKPDSIEASYD